jgi:hypothetical protein
MKFDTTKMFKIKILGVEYTIHISNELLQKVCEMYEDVQEETHGFHIGFSREIYVTDKAEPWQIAQTLLHELVHAIGNVAGHPQLAVSTRKNEHLVDAIAYGLVTALADPKLFQFLGELLGVSKEVRE